MGSTPTLEVALLVVPELLGVGIKGNRPLEVELKQDVGILLPAHCCPAAGAVQPAGATKPCGTKIGTQSADEIVEKILHLPEGTKVFVMAPVDRRDGEAFDTLWDDLRGSGFSRGPFLPMTRAYTGSSFVCL